MPSPPTIAMRPSCSTVAVCPERASIMADALDHALLTGSYISEELSGPLSFRPPVTRTVPSANTEQVWLLRGAPMGDTAANVPWVPKTSEVARVPPDPRPPVTRMRPSGNGTEQAPSRAAVIGPDCVHLLVLTVGDELFRKATNQNISARALEYRNTERFIVSRTPSSFRSMSTHRAVTKRRTQTLRQVAKTGEIDEPWICP
jgi:hypothetical protein